MKLGSRVSLSFESYHGKSLGTNMLLIMWLGVDFDFALLFRFLNCLQQEGLPSHCNIQGKATASKLEVCFFEQYCSNCFRIIRYLLLPRESASLKLTIKTLFIVHSNSREWIPKYCSCMFVSMWEDEVSKPMVLAIKSTKVGMPWNC